MRIKKIDENYIVFDNGYELEAFHEQDCCEHVYADFEVLNTYNVSTKTGQAIDIKEIDFEESLEKLVQGILGMGFNMLSKIDEKFFVTCYNEQNGCYSSNLGLILHKGKIREVIDISEFVKDEIY